MRCPNGHTLSFESQGRDECHECVTDREQNGDMPDLWDEALHDPERHVVSDEYRRSKARKGHQNHG